MSKFCQNPVSNSGGATRVQKERDEVGLCIECVRDIWSASCGRAVDCEGPVRFKSVTERTETLRVGQPYYLLLLSGESLPSVKHDKNSKRTFDESIAIDFIFCQYLCETRRELQKGRRGRQRILLLIRQCVDSHYNIKNQRIYYAVQKLPPVFRRVLILAKSACFLRHIRPSVRLSAYIGVGLGCVDLDWVRLGYFLLGLLRLL
jgi:hypothetical protein